jgi:hypothetical protein
MNPSPSFFYGLPHLPYSYHIPQTPASLKLCISIYLFPQTFLRSFTSSHPPISCKDMLSTPQGILRSAAKICCPPLKVSFSDAISTYLHTGCTSPRALKAMKPFNYAVKNSVLKDRTCPRPPNPAPNFVPIGHPGLLLPPEYY